MKKKDTLILPGKFEVLQFNDLEDGLGQGDCVTSAPTGVFVVSGVATFVLIPETGFSHPATQMF